MRKIFGLVIIFLLIFTCLTYAQTTIKAEVDKLKLTTDDTLTYKLTITSEEKQIPEPQIPDFKSFKLLSSAQSSTLSFLKSNIRTIMVYAFILIPSEVGKFKIEPSKIKMNNNIYKTDVFEIEVTQGHKRPEFLPKEKPSLPEEDETGSEEPQYIL